MNFSYLLLPAIQEFIYPSELNAVSIETFKIPAAVLVLCPCTVLSEWRNHTWAASLQASTFNSLCTWLSAYSAALPDTGSVSFAHSVDGPQLLRDPSQEDRNKSSTFCNGTYAKCISTFLFLCEIHSTVLFKHFSLLSCMQNKGNRENWETWLWKEGCEGEQEKEKYAALSLYHSVGNTSMKTFSEGSVISDCFPLHFSPAVLLQSQPNGFCFMFLSLKRAIVFLLAGHLQCLLTCLTCSKPVGFLGVIKVPSKQVVSLTHLCHQQQEGIFLRAGFPGPARCQAARCGDMLPLEFNCTFNYTEVANSCYKSYPITQISGISFTLCEII